MAYLLNQSLAAYSYLISVILFVDWQVKDASDVRNFDKFAAEVNDAPDDNSGWDKDF